MPTSSHFIATLLPTAIPVVAGEAASRVQVAVDGPRDATVIVLPTAPSPIAETLPSTMRACGLGAGGVGFGFGAGFAFGHVGPTTTASTEVELVEPTAPEVKPGRMNNG